MQLRHRRHAVASGLEAKMRDLPRGLLVLSMCSIPGAGFAELQDGADLALPPIPGAEYADTLLDHIPIATPQGAFEQELAPYGRWIDGPDCGRLWVPFSVGSDWQPYPADEWGYTDWGLSLVATEPWGWATYRYGRWGHAAELGWFWVPDFVWVPSWASWRPHQEYPSVGPLEPVG
jgi:hypothetical protein